MTPQLEASPETVAPATDPGKPVADPGPEVAHLRAVPLHADVILGTLRMKLGEISQLKAGSILKTQRSAGDPLDILINSSPLAIVEVSPCGEKLGVRVMELRTDD